MWLERRRETHMSKQTDEDEPQAPHGIQGLTTEAGPAKLKLGTRLRNYFLTGIVVAAPVSITVYITWWFVNLVDGWIKPFLPTIYNPDHYLPFTVPGVGLIFAIFGLTVLGALTANLFGRTIVSYGEMMLNRMPIVRNVYSALKQIFETVLSQSQSSFQKAGLIQYPRQGLWSIVFISTATKGEVQHKFPDENDVFSVFLPTTPNPTSGFLLFVPRKDVILLDMSVEEAAKMIISAGLVTPKYHEKTAKLAETATVKAKAAIKPRPKQAKKGKAPKVVS